jgi:hypothetical protein
LNLCRSVEQLDPGAQGNVELVFGIAACLGNFLQVEKEQRFAVLWQIVWQAADLHRLVLAGSKPEQGRGRHERHWRGGVVCLGIDPGLGGEGALAGVGDYHRGAALGAFVDDARTADGKGGVSAVQQAGQKQQATAQQRRGAGDGEHEK